MSAVAASCVASLVYEVAVLWARQEFVVSVGPYHWSVAGNSNINSACIFFYYFFVVLHTCVVS